MSSVKYDSKAYFTLHNVFITLTSSIKQTTEIDNIKEKRVLGRNCIVIKG